MRIRSAASSRRCSCRRVRGRSPTRCAWPRRMQISAAWIWRIRQSGFSARSRSRDQPLKEGDRIELYRPLLEEPKLARRKRASRKAG